MSIFCSNGTQRSGGFTKFRPVLAPRRYFEKPPDVRRPRSGQVRLVVQPPERCSAIRGAYGATSSRGYAPGGAFARNCSFENETVLASVIYQPKTVSRLAHSRCYLLAIIQLWLFYQIFYFLALAI